MDLTSLKLLLVMLIRFCWPLHVSMFFWSFCFPQSHVTSLCPGKLFVWICLFCFIAQSDSTMNVGKVRDGKSINKQSKFQTITDRVAFNWDSFVGNFSNGQSQNVTKYNVTTIEKETGRIVMGPRIVTFSESDGPELIFEDQTDANLIHNMTYFTTINTRLCRSQIASSNGFRVDTTPAQIGEFDVGTEMWSVGDNFTIKWEDVIDLESGVDEIEIWIIDALTNSTFSESGCTNKMKMNSTSTSISDGEVKLAWSECGTQYPGVTKLSTMMRVTNGAGLNTTRRSGREFEIAGVRITNLANFDGSSHDGWSNIISCFLNSDCFWMDGFEMFLSLIKIIIFVLFS